MRKYIRLAAVIPAVFLLGCAGAGETGLTAAKDTLEKQILLEELTEEEALGIVLDDAGVTENDITVTKLELDQEAGYSEYEIEFYTNETEYDYRIDASIGKVLKRSKESREAPAGTSSDSGLITEEEAVETALKDAGFSRDEVAGLKAELDRDDGRPEYEIEFFRNGTEYNYDIDAQTGEITGTETE